MYAMHAPHIGKKDRVPSPLVQHPPRNLSVRQIAAEFEGRPSVEADLTVINSTTTPTFTQFEPAREFSSSPALWLNPHSTNPLQMSPDRLRSHPAAHSYAHLVTPEYITHSVPAASHLRPRSSTMPLHPPLPARPARHPSADRPTSVSHAAPADHAIPKPPRIQSLPSGSRYEAVSEMIFGDDASSLTGPSDGPAGEFETRPHTPANPSVVPIAAAPPLRTSDQHAVNNVHPVTPQPLQQTAHLSPLDRTESRVQPTAQLQPLMHCNAQTQVLDDAVESSSMAPVGSPLLFIDQNIPQAQSASNIRDISELTDSNAVQRACAANNHVVEGNDDIQPQRVHDGVSETFDTPSASAAFLLTGPAVAAAAVDYRKLDKQAEHEQGTTAISAAEARLGAMAYIGASQDALAQEVEDTWDNVEYVVTEPYQRDAQESDALGDRSTGADIHAPAAMPVARWRFLSSIGAKMGRRRGTGGGVGGNGDVVEDIHQSTLAEGSPVYTEDKHTVGSKGARRYMTHIFSRNNVRNGALWLEFSSPMNIERMLSEVGKIAKSLGYQVWRRPGENKLRCIRRLTHRHEMHMVIVVGSIGLPDGPMTVVRLRRARGDRNRTEAWRYAHFYRELIDRLQRFGVEISGGE